MIYFEKPTDSPNPYCVVELSDGRKVFETNVVQFWRELKNFCVEQALNVKRVYIIDESGKERPIKRNNATCYFIVREGRFSLRHPDKQSIKKGYGVICKHPGGIVKTYIEWYYDNSGKFVYSEVMRDAAELHREILGIQAAR